MKKILTAILSLALACGLGLAVVGCGGGEYMINVSGGGSGVGISSAKEGTVEMGMASKKVEGEDAEGLEVYAICQDGIAVVVNNANTAVTDLTIEDIYGNEIVCDLYSVERSGEEAYVYIDKMGPVVMTHTISDDGTTEKWSYNLSTRDDVHIGSSTVDYDMEAGDTLVYLWQEKGNIYNPETAVTMYVTSCEDGVLTYYNEFRGEEMTTTPENFVSFGEDYEGESKGQAVYYNLSYGYRLCNVYHIEDERGSQTLIVGAEDGVCYYIRMVVDGVTYGGELAYASMVSGDYPTKDRTEEGIGDWSSTMHVTVDADGNVSPTGSTRRRSTTTAAITATPVTV